MNDSTPKDCVKALTPFFREHPCKIEGTVTEFLIQKCPRGQLCRNPLGEVAFRKNSGNSNPFWHLLACYKNKDELLNEVRMLILNKLKCPTIIPTSKERAIFRI